MINRLSTHSNISISTTSPQYHRQRDREAKRSSYDTISDMSCNHCLNSGGDVLFHSLKINLVAVTAPTFITVRSYFDACGSSVWSPKRHNLGDFGIVILFAFSICSMTFSQNGLTNLHSQSACTNVPVSVWHFQHKLLAKIPILYSLEGVK